MTVSAHAGPQYRRDTPGGRSFLRSDHTNCAGQGCRSRHPLTKGQDVARQRSSRHRFSRGWPVSQITPLLHLRHAAGSGRCSLHKETKQDIQMVRQVCNTPPMGVSPNEHRYWTDTTMAVQTSEAIMRRVANERGDPVVIKTGCINAEQTPSCPVGRPAPPPQRRRWHRPIKFLRRFRCCQHALDHASAYQPGHHPVP